MRLAIAFYFMIVSVQASNEGTKFFLGLDLGYVKTDTNVATEFNKNGFQISPKVVASYAWPKWVIDGGLGWTYQRLMGAEPPVATETITTRSALAEISGRYRLNDSWQIGPIARSLFGSTLKFGTNTSTAESAFFGGLQGVYEIPCSKAILRLTAQTFTDLTIENRQVYIVEAGIQIGFAPFQGTTTSVEKSEPSQSVRVDLQGDRFYFEFKSSHLTDSARTYLKTMAKFLTKNFEKWEALQIDGHTDARGSDVYNLRLSTARAKAVELALIENGIPKKRIKVAGLGFHRPRSTGNDETAYRENRRVELKFTGVGDPATFLNALKQLKR